MSRSLLQVPNQSLSLHSQLPSSLFSFTNVTGFWKTYLLGTYKNFGKVQMKISIFKKKNYFSHLDKATIKPSCCEVSHPKLLFLGDMDDCIRPCSNFTCVGNQLTYELVICSGAGMAKTKCKQCRCHLIVEKYQEYFIKLSEISLKVF